MYVRLPAVETCLEIRSPGAYVFPPATNKKRITLDNVFYFLIDERFAI